MSYDGAGEGGSEDEEDEKEWEKYSSNDNVMFLIDAREQMMEECPTGEPMRGTDQRPTYFYKALESAMHMMKGKIISAEKDKIGIVFMGVKEGNMSTEILANIYQFLKLDAPKIESTRKLQALMQHLKCFGELEKDDEGYFGGSLTSADLCPLRAALHACWQELKLIKNKEDWKRIFIFTNDDYPIQNEKEQESTEQAAKDAAETGVTVEIFPSELPGHKFDITKFYSRVRIGDDGEYTSSNVTGASDFKKVEQRVRRRQYKKRRLCCVPLHLAGADSYTETEGVKLPKVSFEVEVYSSIKKVGAPSKITLHAATNVQIKSTTFMMDNETGSSLEDHEVRTYRALPGGDRVAFSRAEYKAAKSVGAPGLVLIDFRPLSFIQDEWTVREPYFIYPSEELCEGSSKAFAALNAVMLEKKQLALVRVALREPSTPQLGCLVPQEEIIEDEEQVQPPGMHLIMVPFKDEVRTNDFARVPRHTKPDEAAVEAAMGVIAATMIPDFDCRSFENPVLQMHYRGLETLAQAEGEDDYDEWQDSMDTTAPSKETTEKIDKALAPFLEKLS